MISACYSSTKGLYAFDYDTRTTNNGYTYETASAYPGTKWGISVSAIY